MSIESFLFWFATSALMISLFLLIFSKKLKGE